MTSRICIVDDSPPSMPLAEWLVREQLTITLKRVGVSEWMASIEGDATCAPGKIVMGAAAVACSQLDQPIKALTHLVNRLRGGTLERMGVVKKIPELLLVDVAFAVAEREYREAVAERRE